MITHNKIKLLTVLSVLAFSLVYAINFQDEEELKNVDKNMENFEINMHNWEIQMEKWGDDLEKSIEQGETIPPLPPVPSLKMVKEFDDKSLKLGIYIENMDFEEAYQRHYPGD